MHICDDWEGTCDVEWIEDTERETTRNLVSYPALEIWLTTPFTFFGITPRPLNSAFKHRSIKASSGETLGAKKKEKGKKKTPPVKAKTLLWKLLVQTDATGHFENYRYHLTILSVSISPYSASEA